MLIECITVITIRDRTSYRDGMYVVAVMTGVRVRNKGLTWCLTSVMRTPHYILPTAVIDAEQTATQSMTPYIPGADHDDMVHEDEYRAACEAAGIFCPLPEPGPASTPAAVEGGAA